MGDKMNRLLWVLQVLAALLYGSSGVMKVFMFDPGDSLSWPLPLEEGPYNFGSIRIPRRGTEYPPGAIIGLRKGVAGAVDGDQFYLYPGAIAPY
jgi:hypothetical protein